MSVSVSVSVCGSVCLCLCLRVGVRERKEKWGKAERHTKKSVRNGLSLLGRFHVWVSNDTKVAHAATITQNPHSCRKKFTLSKTTHHAKMNKQQRLIDSLLSGGAKQEVLLLPGCPL